MTSQARRNTCAVCPRGIDGWRLMCWHHWAQVPRAVQQRVNAAWRATRQLDAAAREQARPEYEAARQAAIDSISTTTQGARA